MENSSPVVEEMTVLVPSTSAAFQPCGNSRDCSTGMRSRAFCVKASSGTAAPSGSGSHTL
ncbi:hypothetical protein D3C87_1705990 [compost metagenome]